MRAGGAPSSACFGAAAGSVRGERTRPIGRSCTPRIVPCRVDGPEPGIPAAMPHLVTRVLRHVPVALPPCGGHPDRSTVGEYSARGGVVSTEKAPRPGNDNHAGPEPGATDSPLRRERRREETSGRPVAARDRGGPPP